MDDLLRDLEEHRVQLAQVNDMLAINPHDAEVQKLKADLDQVLNITLDMLRQKQQEQGITTASSSSSSSSSTSTPSSSSSSSASASTSSGSIYQDLPDLEQHLEEQKRLHAQYRARWSPADRCQAIWEEDGKYYVAIIDEIFETPQASGFDCTVTFLEYGNTGRCSMSALRAYEPAPPDSLTPGVRVKAIWPADHLFVDGLIESQSKTEAGVFVVNFTGKKNKKKKQRLLEVAARDIVLRAAGPVGVQDAMEQKYGSGEVKLEDLPDEVVIPEKLEVKATDSDAQKRIKLKKIKRMKSTHNMKKKEAETNHRKNSWLSFQAKTTAAGGKERKGKKRKSIWATPDVVSGTEGVTSAYKMTKFHDRGRHVFEQMPTSSAHQLPPNLSEDGP